jgi:hypothetical protein
MYLQTGFCGEFSALSKSIAQPLMGHLGIHVSPSASGTLACKTHAHDWRL